LNWLVAFCQDIQLPVDLQILLMSICNPRYNTTRSGNEVVARMASVLNTVRMSGFRDRLSHQLSMGDETHHHRNHLFDESRILVLDEPSHYLRARRALINLLRELLITMLVSMHDMKA
jgi:ABC-type Mn2+/Zn2+ transport system ATPase subunit